MTQVMTQVMTQSDDAGDDADGGVDDSDKAEMLCEGATGSWTSVESLVSFLLRTSWTL